MKMYMSSYLCIRSQYEHGRQKCMVSILHTLHDLTRFFCGGGRLNFSPNLENAEFIPLPEDKSKPSGGPTPQLLS